MLFLIDGAVAGDSVDDGGVELLAVVETHLGGEGGGGAPLGGGARAGLLHHLVDLLKGETLGFGDEEVGVDEGAGAETTPDEEDAGFEVSLILGDHEGSDDTDDGVPQPVGGGRKSDTTGSDGQREDLTDQDPGTRTPGGGEEEDEDGDECDLGVDGANVDSAEDLGTSSVGTDRVGLVESDGDTDDGDNELTDQHAESSPDQKWATTELLNGVERDGSRAHVDEGEDQGDQEDVVDGTGGLQERSRVVEDEVDTSPLLHHLERGTKNGLAQVGV